LVGQLEGKRALGRPKCKWEFKIKVDVKGIKLEGVD
jgi:hypothetical protein